MGVYNERTMNPDKIFWQDRLHVADLLLGSNWVAMSPVDLNVICQTLNINQFVKTHPGGLSVGTNGEVAFLYLGLFLLQFCDDLLINKIVFDQKNKGLEENNEI